MSALITGSPSGKACRRLSVTVFVVFRVQKGLGPVPDDDEPIREVEIDRTEAMCALGINIAFLPLPDVMGVRGCKAFIKSIGESSLDTSSLCVGDIIWKINGTELDTISQGSNHSPP